MTSASPYRTRPGPVSTLVVSPFTLPRRVLVFLLVVFAAPLLLHVFLWSRVVTVRCERGAGEQVWCDVDESSIASSSESRVDAAGALRADVRGATYKWRGDAWIVLLGRRGETQLTSGFNGDKAAQRATAAALTDFLRDPRRRSVELSFGSRWSAAWIFLVLDSLLLSILYPVFGQRLRATADRSRDTLELHRRVWPLPGARVVLPLSRLARFDIATERGGRFRLVALTHDQQAHPVTWPVGLALLLFPAVLKLNAWAEEERANYRSSV